MERIFTPWRLSYLSGTRDQSDCLFCVARERRDEEALILHRGPAAYVIINLYPYSNGHLMVVPNRHVGALSEATAEERRALVEATARCEQILQESYRPDGMNVGMNLGAAAGAGVVGHLHVHLVPRWNGDTNFATVLGETRIIPETPSQTFSRLGPIFLRRPPGEVS